MLLSFLSQMPAIKSVHVFNVSVQSTQCKRPAIDGLSNLCTKHSSTLVLLLMMLCIKAALIILA